MSIKCKFKNGHNMAAYNLYKNKMSSLEKNRNMFLQILFLIMKQYTHKQ